MGLRFDPIGGGQFKQAVQQIMEAESQPLKNMQARKTREEAKLKLFTEFKSKFMGLDHSLEDLSSFKKFRELKVDLGDAADMMSVTVDKDKAQPGSYEMTIEDLAQRTSIISNAFNSPDKPALGTGFIVMNMMDGSSKEILVEEEQSSLNGVMRLINDQKDAPVRATVVKDVSDSENPWKLIISAKKDGKDNQIDFPDFYFLDGEKDFYLDNNRDAQNAIVRVNGFPIEVESNDVKEFLPGVNIHLKQANSDKPFTMNITEDFQKIAGKVKQMVDGVNGVLDFVNTQNQIDEKSDTRTTFAGDTSLQTVEYRLRNMMHEGFGVGDPEDDDNFKIYWMSDLGIEFDKGGHLAFKEDKFTKFMENDFDSLSEVFTGPMGFAHQMKTIIQGYTQRGNGLLAIRESSMRDQIKTIDDQIGQKQQMLERRQQSLTDQFSRLEASLGSLQRQQQYLSATLPGAGGGGNLVSQLLGG